MGVATMFTKIRRRVADAGPSTVISILALTIAMCGVSFAATASKTKKKGVLITKLSQISPSVRAQLKGQTGPAGPAGPAGPVGPAGQAGAKGDTGAAGTNGTNGTNGAPGDDGESVVINEIPVGDEFRCNKLGGTEVSLENDPPESGELVCNGADGAAGPEGSPWTAGGTLPPGATEVATWSFQNNDETEIAATKLNIFVPVSFSIPLSVDTILSAEESESTDEDGDERIQFGPGGTTECPGSSLNPLAKPGYACIYESPTLVFNTEFLGLRKAPFLTSSEGFGSSGAYLEFKFNIDPAESAIGFGSIAITGCSNSLPVGNVNKCPQAPAP